MADKENNAEIHGYRWSDGTTRHHPEPKKPRMVGNSGVFVADQPYSEYELMKMGLHKSQIVENKPRKVTRELYDKAFAEWLKDFMLWRREMDEWQHKHGSKK